MYIKTTEHNKGMSQLEATVKSFIHVVRPLESTSKNAIKHKTSTSQLRRDHHNINPCTEVIEKFSCTYQLSMKM